MTKWIILVLAPLGALSSKNWILVWVFLEFSSMMFILLGKNKTSSECLLKYFLIQTLGSVFIILSMSLKMLASFKSLSNSTSLLSSIIIMSMILKAGMVPVHLWMIQICKSFKSLYLLLFLSIQKLAPLGILLMSSNIILFSIIMVMNSIVGTISQLYSLNLNIILTFSSISHSGWIILSGMNSLEMFMIYFSIYTIIISQILVNFEKSKSKEILSMSNSNSTIISFMSLGGLPPLLGFFPKWLSIHYSIQKSNMKITCFILTIFACLNIFIYLRIFSLSIFKSPLQKKSKDTPLSSTSNFINISPLLFFFSPKL
uniref:NADH-ubiquinone oxidoreductase chain 2 n=1 Tax=Arrenurus rostratus TaxID=3136836 RepID=A0AAU6QDS5_9ACAR